jgi:hypothetical protein
MKKINPIYKFISLCLFASFICFTLAIITRPTEKEEVYIQKEPQLSRLINEPDVPYIEVYRAPCRNDELIECIYMRIYPSATEEIYQYERSQASDSP